MSLRFYRRACALALALLSGTCFAQAYPSKPVRMIVGFPPGGGTDVVARVISQKLTEWWGQAVTVENRAGATGTIGADVVAKSAPDGYTLIMGHVNSHAIAPNLFAKLPYNAIKDFSAVAYVGYVPNVLAVHPSVGVKTVKELVAILRAKPGQLNYASSGNGSTQHLAGEMFKQLTGTSIVHVPYKGSGDAIKDLLAGVVAMNFDTMPPVLPHIQAGKLRGLAISTPKRLPQLPDVPTFQEEGIVGFDVSNWYGVMAPAGTSREIVAKLNADINKAMQVPEVRQRLESVGTQLREQSAAEFEGYMKAEVTKYAKLIKDTGVRVE
ncbi:MAG TPA: tripartite tricarboxylate transporter substrate binding protein [Burkholderiales bacterium]|jgi:tripartite-type tricarboxylate transporter receptor subunit TctC|nr:tripartite tricarboxylate transporter substrate binding protein [Burkholderiales bacterium]